MSSSYIGAYWGSRRESPLAGGQRLSRCLADLGRIDPALAKWFQRGMSKAAAKEPAGATPAELGVLFERGVNRRDFGGAVIEELGYSVGLWNRARSEVGMSAKCGAYSPSMLNSFVLNIPDPNEGAESLYQFAHATAIFDAIVQAWDPEWATWSTHEWREAQSPAPREPVVGWLTYLKGPLNVHLRGADARSLAGGSAIWLGDDITKIGTTSILNVRGELAKLNMLAPIL